MPTALVLVVMGFATGFIVGSWWLAPIAPLAIIVDVEFWPDGECVDCRPAEGGGPPIWIGLILVAGLLAIPALSAVAGTLCARYLEQRHDSATLFGVAVPVVIPLLGVWLHDTGRVDLSRTPLLVASLLIIGFLTGFLLRKWWAVGYAIVVGIPWPLSVESGYFSGSMIEAILDMVGATLIWGILPLAVGATIGVLVSRVGERPGTTEIFS